jgi:hypothetical protein
VVRWSETAILGGAPAVSAELHGWGLSVSRSGDFQLSAVSGRYVECYSLRDGGIGRRAELVNTDVRENVTAEARRRNQTVDALYREWSRHRGDVALLQRLHDAIHQCLEHQSQPA